MEHWFKMGFIVVVLSVDLFHYLSYRLLECTQYKLHKWLKHSISTST